MVEPGKIIVRLALFTGDLIKYAYKYNKDEIYNYYLILMQRYKKEPRVLLVLFFVWCRWSDSNRHGIATTGF